MRITIGHVLMIGVIGFVGFQFYSGKQGRPAGSIESNQGLWVEVQSWMNLFKSGESSVPSSRGVETDVPKDLNESVNPPGKEKVATDVAVSTSVAVAPAVVAATSVPTVAPVSVKPVVAVAPKAKPRKRLLRRKKVVATPVAVPTKETVKKAEPASPAVAGDPLIGNYVRIELTSGKTVQGILQERNATELKLELPGMGPIPYPMSTVKSIKAME